MVKSADKHYKTELWNLDGYASGGRHGKELNLTTLIYD